MKTKLIIGAAIIAVGMISCGATVGDKKTDATKETVTQEEGKVIHIDKAKFLEMVWNYEINKEWKYEGNVPAIVDFYADWCGPCRMASPILDEIAAEYKGKVIIYKVDTDDEKELSAVLGIRGLPTFLYIPVNGEPSVSSGIGRTTQETKQMFGDVINQNLLEKKETSL